MEAKLTSEKEEEIKMVEAEILQLKADIYNLKVLRKIFRNLKKRLVLLWINYAKLGFMSRDENISIFKTSKFFLWVVRLAHGLINYIDTKEKCRHL